MLRRPGLLRLCVIKEIRRYDGGIRVVEPTRLALEQPGALVNRAAFGVYRQRRCNRSIRGRCIGGRCRRQCRRIRRRRRCCATATATATTTGSCSTTRPHSS
eukprot:COSAG01_NODE_19491_length_1007_cov_0.547357_1_plen_101_part_10